MNSAAFTAVMPLVCLAAAVVALMLLIAVYRRHLPALLMTIAGLASAIVWLLQSTGQGAVAVTPLLIFDGYARVYLVLFCGAGIATALLSYGYLCSYDGPREEYYLLLLLAVLGSAVLAVSHHFAALFLGLEILSVSLYTLIAYPHRTQVHVEAGVKYLVLAAVSSAFLLFGLALFYAGSGRMEIAPVSELLRTTGQPAVRWLAAGAAMMIVAIGFKLAVVPFHLWTPDVYQGSPAPVAAFVATVSKGAVVALLLRLFPPAGLTAWLYTAFALLSMASMIAGNLLALLQDNVKRILAYSSIAHLGYLLVAYLAGGPTAVHAVTFYLVTYFVTTLGAFGIVTLLSSAKGEAESLEDYRGLFRRRPALAIVLALMLLSLAGLPLTAGFLGKFYLVVAGVSEARWMLVITLVATSTIGLYYYLRIVVALFASLPEEPAPLPQAALSGRLTVAGLTAFLVWLGILPGAVIQWIRALL
jgi:NADH-quinone oxidoreductase subunit N